MYYPVGWHKILKVDTQVDNDVCEVISIQANHERTLLLLLTAKSVHLWNARPPVEIVSHKRSAESILKAGRNQSAIWKIDSSIIVVATDYNQLLFYQLRERVSSSSSNLLIQSAFTNLYNNKQAIYKIRKEGKKSHSGDETDFIFDEHIPALSIFLFGKLDLSYVGISCLMSAEEELIVASKNGDIYGVLWNGSLDEKFPWTIVDNSKHIANVVDLKFSSVVGGFSAVFSNGQAGFIPLQAPQVQKEDINHNNDDSSKAKIYSSINYLPNICHAICTEINHKYRLLAFGLEDSKVCVCSIGESNTAISTNHILQLPQNKFPYIDNKLGSVICMKYSPDNFALVTCWRTGGFAIWSVFGSLLFFSGQYESRLCRSVQVYSITWGLEGYNLFMCTKKISEKNLENDSSATDTNSTKSMARYILTESGTNSIETTILNHEEVLVLSLARSAILLSPNTTCLIDSVLLLSEDKIHIGLSVPHCHKFDHWLDIDIPQTYLNKNYPIKYATADRDCDNVAIAGTHGFAVYSIKSESWSFFFKGRNKFSVTGDLIWWNNYLILSCFNLQTNGFEVGAFDLSRHQDKQSYVGHETSQEVIRMSLFENRLLALYADGTMGMFMLNLRRLQNASKTYVTRSNSISQPNSDSNAKSELSANGIRRTREGSLFINPDSTKKFPQDVVLHIAPIEGLVVSNLMANPCCITSVALTRLHFKNNRSDDSILLNACGKLFLLEREVAPSLNSTSPTSELSSDNGSRSPSSQQVSDLEKRLSDAKVASNHIQFASASLRNTPKPSSTFVAFKTVTMIATNVEHYWISPDISHASELSYFRKSLWLYCGGLNYDLGVWLPLLIDKNDPPNTHQYTPNRIMLRIMCDIYPLAIKSSTQKEDNTLDDTIILGAENDIMFGDSPPGFAIFPFYTLKRQCQVYLHRILLELLKRNLGYYAQKIAKNCQSLPYFAHSFELLLHEVLEEEATSPKPIPDPMLPQVIEFIKQFSVYLETVVHCARKSELAMWPHLFSIVGNPRKLFQDCLDSANLDIAASCLLILQSFDRSNVSQQMVTELIDHVQKQPKYNYLIKELETFFVRAELDISAISTNPSPIGPQKVT